MAKLPTCWRREGALGNRPPPSPGLPGKMSGTEEAPRGVGIILCCLGALGWWGGLLRQPPLPRLFSLPPALSGMRRSPGVRAEWDARQVERVEESRPQGLVQCGAARVGFG